MFTHFRKYKKDYSCFSIKPEHALTLKNAAFVSLEDMQNLVRKRLSIPLGNKTILDVNDIVEMKNYLF